MILPASFALLGRRAASKLRNSADISTRAAAKVAVACRDKSAGTACKPRRGLTQTSLVWDVKFIRNLRLYIRNLRIYIRNFRIYILNFRIYIRNLRFYFMHRPGEIYPPGSAGLCTGQRPLPPESGACGCGIAAPAMHGCGRGGCERCVIVPPHQTFLLVVAVAVLWMIVAMTGRAAAV